MKFNREPGWGWIKVLTYKTSTCYRTFEFSLNDLTQFSVLTLIFVIMVKCLKPATFYVRNQDATTVPARHMFTIHAPVIYQIPTIHWISLPFRENSTDIPDKYLQKFIKYSLQITAHISYALSMLLCHSSILYILYCLLFGLVVSRNDMITPWTQGEGHITSRQLPH